MSVPVPDYTKDAVSAFTLYETMTTDELVHVRDSFRAALTEAVRTLQADKIVFAAGRLALIGVVLASRGILDTPS